MSQLPPSLSPQGLARREEILAFALNESLRRRRKRMVARAAVAIIMVAAVIVPVLRFRSRRAPSMAIKPQPAHTAPPSFPPVLVTRIETDPHIVERLSIPPQRSHVIVIGDSELLKELAEAHQPAGLAYVNGKAMLLFR